MSDQQLKTQSTKAVSVTTPADLIAMAVQQGADIDKLEKLMQLQERYDANEAKKAFIQARSYFSGESIEILKTTTGHNSKYATLGNELEIVTPLLSKHGLSHNWVTNQDNNVITVTCILTHIQGHSESTSLSSSPETSGSKNSIQAIGSAVSYLKRYTFESICGLASKDDDGRSSTDKQLPPEKIKLMDELNISARKGMKALVCHFNKLDEAQRIGLDMKTLKGIAIHHDKDAKNAS